MWMKNEYLKMRFKNELFYEIGGLGPSQAYGWMRYVEIQILKVFWAWHQSRLTMLKWTQQTSNQRPVSILFLLAFITFFLIFSHFSWFFHIFSLPPPFFLFLSFFFYLFSFFSKSYQSPPSPFSNSPEPTLPIDAKRHGPPSHPRNVNHSSHHRLQNRPPRADHIFEFHETYQKNPGTTSQLRWHRNHAARAGERKHEFKLRWGQYSTSWTEGKFRAFESAIRAIW